MGGIARVVRRLVLSAAEHRAANLFLTDDPSFLSGSPLLHTLLRARLPATAADAATALFGNVSSHSAQVYAATGSTDAWIGDWSPRAPAVLGGGAPLASCRVRQVQRRQPVRTKLSPVRSTRVHERHMLVGTADGAQLLIMEQTMLDIPLHDYFTVVIKLCLTDDASNQQRGGAGGAGRANPMCKLDVSMEVHFHRSTWFESHIQAKTRKELRSYYATAAPLMRVCLEERTRALQP